MRLRSVLVLMTMFWTVGVAPAHAIEECDVVAAVGARVLKAADIAISVEVWGIGAGSCHNTGVVVTAQMQGAGQGADACVEADCSAVAETAGICCPIKLGSPLVATAEASGPGHAVGHDVFILTMDDCGNFLDQ